MVALLPFNYLNARLEQARQEIETSAAQIEMLLLRSEKQTRELT
jgi:biopolymer transport protein ExbB